MSNCLEDVVYNASFASPKLKTMRKTFSSFCNLSLMLLSSSSSSALPSFEVPACALIVSPRLLPQNFPVLFALKRAHRGFIAVLLLLLTSWSVVVVVRGFVSTISFPFDLSSVRYTLRRFRLVRNSRDFDFVVLVLSLSFVLLLLRDDMSFERVSYSRFQRVKRELEF